MPKMDFPDVPFLPQVLQTIFAFLAAAPLPPPAEGGVARAPSPPPPPRKPLFAPSFEKDLRFELNKIGFKSTEINEPLQKKLAELFARAVHENESETLIAVLADTIPRFKSRHMHQTFVSLLRDVEDFAALEQKLVDKLLARLTALAIFDLPTEGKQDEEDEDNAAAKEEERAEAILKAREVYENTHCFFLCIDHCVLSEWLHNLELLLRGTEDNVLLLLPSDSILLRTFYQLADYAHADEDRPKEVWKEATRTLCALEDSPRLQELLSNHSDLRFYLHRCREVFVGKKEEK